MSIFNLFGSKSKKADVSKKLDSDSGSHEDRVKEWKEKEAARKAGGNYGDPSHRNLKKDRGHKQYLERELKKRKSLEKLLDRYGREFADAVRDKKLKIDMPRELVDELFGQPEDTKESVTKTKTKVRAFYGAEEGARGGTSYRLEVSFENDKVTGWKES